jgi:adenylate cyclase
MNNEPRPERRLAAILASDVVGYSSLMQSDEAGTLAALTTIREATEKQVERHRGRVANTAGDSILAEFTSAVDAVSCAMVLQEVVTQQSANNCGLQIRIGIHTGDVIVRAGDLFGTAVNVAARLEGLSQPGGIVVSAAVKDDVTGKLPATYVDLGLKSLKNISEPLRVFAVTPQIGSSAAAIQEVDRRLRLPHEALVAIAILPFASIGSGPEQSILADGLTEDLITELSRNKDYLVIARNTVFTYKNRPVDVGQIGRELGVRYLVEGSVRRLGSRIRITAQLIETSTGTHLWAEKFDREVTEVFDVQDEVVRAVAACTQTRLVIREGEIAERTAGAGLEFWTLAKRGQAANYQSRAECWEEAVEIGTELIERFPTRARGHQILAEALYSQLAMGQRQPTSELKDRIVAAARQAARLDPSDEYSLWVYGLILSLLLGRAEEALAVFRQTLSINPNFCRAFELLGNTYCLLNQPEQAISSLEIAIRLDPRDPSVFFCYSALAHANFIKEDHQKTLHWAHQASALRPDFWWPHALAAATFSTLGDVQKAAQSAEDLFQAWPAATLAAIKAIRFCPDHLWPRLSQGLLAAGIVNGQ